MFSLVALVALLGLANAQLDLSDRNDLNVDASVYLHVEIDQVFYNKTTPNTTASDRVVLQFSKVGLRLPIKDNVQDEKASLENLAKPYFFMSSTCVATSWNSTGRAALPSPHVVIDDRDTYIYQWVDYADEVMYADFERPFFEFQVDAFVQGTPSTSCTPGMTDDVTRVNFTERLCYTEDSFCNVWVGQSGWLYFGGGNGSTNATFGIHVQPRWNWTGTRELFELNDTNFLDVRPVDRSSDVFAETQAMLSRNVSIPFEFNECKIKRSGALLFHVNENGFLERQLSCNSIEWEDNSYVVFDFANKFDETKLADLKLPGEDRWNFTFYIARVKYASTFDVQINPDRYEEPWVELNRLPTGYYLSGIDWLTTIEYNSGKMDLVKTWFTVEKFATRPPATTTTPRPTFTTVPPPVCPKDCSAHGSCVVGNTCQCDVGFRADAIEGCISLQETTVLTSSTAPIAIITTEPLVVTTVPTTTGTFETSPTKDPLLTSGTFSGTRAPTNPPITQPGVTTAPPTTNTETGGVAQVAVSAIASTVGVLALLL